MTEVAADAIVFEPLGETTLLVRFGNAINAEINARVHDAAVALRCAALPGVVDLVPAFATLALRYAPAAWADRTLAPWQQLADAARAAIDSGCVATRANTQAKEIAVCYGGDAGIDLEHVASHCGLDADEVIARHTASDYRVAMLGFAPGFAYLLGLDPTLEIPRRATPRLRVPAGSVAIGGAQTGVYPAELPGGWHLIGRTPTRLFDPARAPPCLLAPGDRVRFRAIDANEFAALSA